MGEILRLVPDANIVLVRTRSVGQHEQLAPTGSRPNFLRCLRALRPACLSNLLSLRPAAGGHHRRAIDRGQPARPGPRHPQPLARGWYNAQGPEPPTYVPYHFVFGRRTYEFPPGGAEELI